MYRLLAAHQEVRERRDQLRHPRYARSRAPRPSGQRVVELGHHQVARTCEVDLLPPTSCSTSSAATSSAGWSLIAKLPRWPRSSSARRVPARASTPGSSPSTRIVGGDDVQARCPPARRPRRHQDPRPASRFQRQRVLGGAVQDPEVPAGVPRALWLDPGRASTLPGLYNTEHWRTARRGAARRGSPPAPAPGRRAATIIRDSAC
jgi:hypothetical protein